MMSRRWRFWRPSHQGLYDVQMDPMTTPGMEAGRMVRRHTTTRPLTIAPTAVMLGAALFAGPMPALAQTDTTPAPPPSRVVIWQTTTDVPALVREGAFLYDMRGELRRTELGLVMDFAPDAITGQRLVSMVLQRGMTLTAMEQIIAAHDESIGFVVSGQVFVYHDRNYLLPTRFAIATDVEMAPPQPDSAADPTIPPRPPGLPGFDDEADEPTIEVLLEGIETDTAGATNMPMAPSVGRASRLREGEMIAQIRGRILPGVGGELVFTPDTDADTDASGIEVPPLRCMPCLNVERLEKLRQEWGDRLIVTMSGRIFVDAGRPMLLPTMYVVELERSGNLSLGQ